MSLRKKNRSIVVLGARSVGKSSLLFRLTKNSFHDSYHPTIEATTHQLIEHEETLYQCEIIDTAGQDEYSFINSKYFIGIHVFVLVYSITSRNSFNMVSIIYNKIIDLCGVEKLPCVVVGSKIDLQLSRQVTPSEGEIFAQQIKAGWIEVSAKEGKSVSRVFGLCLGEFEKHTKRKLELGTMQLSQNVPLPDPNGDTAPSNDYAKDRIQCHPLEKKYGMCSIM